MSAVVGALLLTVLIGLPVALAADCAGSFALLGGTSFLFGAGLTAAVLFALSLAAIPWSGPVAAIAIAIVLAGVAPIARRRPWPAWKRPSAGSLLPGSLLVLLVAGYAIYATLGPPPDNDFLAIWGLKGEVFWYHRGIDWAFLRRPEHHLMGVDYPLLLPLYYDFIAVVCRGWNDRWLGLVHVAFGGAAIAVVHHFLRNDARRGALATVTTLAAASAALSPWVGLAEGPLIAFSTAGVLHVRRALQGEVSRMVPGALLLGLAASVKNEGVAMIAAAAAAAMIASGSWRVALRLWPAVAIAFPWLAIRNFSGLTTFVGRGAVAERLLDRVTHLDQFLELLAATPPGKPLMWAGVAAALLIGWRQLVRNELFLMFFAAIQLMFYVAAFMSTPADLAWHIRNASERLVSQIALPAVILALLVLLPALRSEREEPT